MNTLAVIADTDITPYINHKTYSMKHNDQYESWIDGNFVEHRVYIRSRLEGSFDVWLCGMNGMDADAFLDLWNSAVSNHVITMGVFDNTTNHFRAIEAYYEISPSKHQEMMNGNYFDVLKIKVTER